MRICLDIQPAIAQRAGIGRYTKMLAEHLGAALNPGEELGLFYFDFQRKGVPFPVAGAAQRAVRWIPGRFVQRGWRSIGWPPFDWFAGRADVYHFTNFIRPPLSRGRSVVTIHDASMLRLPDTLEEKNYRYLTARIRDTVKRADAIVTISEFTRGELIELLDAPPEKVHTTLLGIEPPKKLLQRGEGSGRPYLLSVGTLEPRKNYPFLIDVFEKLTGFDGDLVIVGGRGWKFEPILERIARSSRRDRIRLCNYVTDDELEGLYAGARLFVMPSLYEGFGFPPLEAMARGVPVVSSAGGSLPEVLGDAAKIIPGYDAGEWASAVSALLDDAAALADLAARGPARAARFTWAETARQTAEIYRKLG